MKYSCELIRDLLPLYHDAVCSAESATAVEEHLAECEACQEQYQCLKDSDALAPPEITGGEQKKTDSLRSVKKVIRRKLIAICAASVAAAVGLCIGTGMFLTSTFVSEPADIITKAELKDNTLEISATTKKDGIGSTVATLRENGKEVSILVCSIDDTLWDSFTHFLQEPVARTFYLELAPILHAEKGYKETHENLPDGTEIIRRTPITTNPEEVPQPFQRVYYYGKTLKEFIKEFSSEELTPDDVAGMTLLWSK